MRHEARRGRSVSGERPTDTALCKKTKYGMLLSFHGRKCEEEGLCGGETHCEFGGGLMPCEEGGKGVWRQADVNANGRGGESVGVVMNVVLRMEWAGMSGGGEDEDRWTRTRG
jgi:hypothetical protein